MRYICQLAVLFAIYTCYIHRDSIKDVSVTLVPLAYEKTDNIIADTKKVSSAKFILREKKKKNMLNKVNSVTTFINSHRNSFILFIIAKMC